MNKRSTLALLLAMLMLVSCGSGTTPTETTTDTVSTETAETTSTEAPAETKATDAMPSTDFGGETFNIVTNNILAGYELPTTQQLATELTGEVINDTLYNRDRWIEEKYNVKVETFNRDEWAWNVINQNYQKGIQSGDFEYELIIEDLAEVTRVLSTSGLVYPLNMIESIHLEKDYWFPKLNEELKVGGDLYFAACPISPRYYGSAYVIMFNRDLAADLGLPDLYETVTDGSWTLDKMDEYAALAVNDANGDGKWTEDDVYGMWYEVLTGESIILGAGHHYIVNEGNTLKVMLKDENLLNVMQKFAGMCQKEYTVYDGGGLDTGVIREKGNYLFWNPCTFNLAEFRDLSHDFGILPMPKGTEAQDGYYGYSQPWANSTALIPITVTGERLTMAGTLTDAMTAYGYDYVRPAVFDNVIQLKTVRDARSAEIIDMIFENVTFELATVLKFGDLYKTTTAYFTSDLGKKEISSSYAAIETKVATEIENILATYAEIHQRLEGSIN